MFFSVKTTVKIMGKLYRPCTCYAVTKVLEATVNKMVSEGNAVLYDNRVFFQNGKIIKSLEERKAEVKAQKKAEKAMKKEDKKTEVNLEAVEKEFEDSDF